MRIPDCLAPLFDYGILEEVVSDFNVLVGAGGPVVIDFPQSVDTAHNAGARKLLLGDVENLHRFLGQFAPHPRRLPYAEEMWELLSAERDHAGDAAHRSLSPIRAAGQHRRRARAHCGRELR
jgi:serine/threonine-protein kinase RIO1